MGYGVNGNIEVAELEKKVVNPNTINSKRTVRFITRKIIEVVQKNGTLFCIKNAENGSKENQEITRTL